MNINTYSESVFSSSFTSGQFNLDPNEMIQLMFSLDNSLTAFVSSWNENIYPLFNTLLQRITDVDAWKVGIGGMTIPVTTNSLLASSWWNKKESRPMSILESIESVSDLITEVKVLEERISKLIKPILARYLTSSFIKLLDTPSNYLKQSIVKYDEFNKELVYVPFVNLTLAQPSSFILLDDTPGVFVDGAILRVSDGSDSIVFESHGYLGRRKVTNLDENGLDIETLPIGNHVLICDDSVGVVEIRLDVPLYEDAIFYIVTPSPFSGVEINPVGITFEGSGAVFPVVTSPFVIGYDSGIGDFKQLGDHL